MIIHNINLNTEISSILEGLFSLIKSASSSLRNKNEREFVELTRIIQLCADYCYNDLSLEIKDKIFDICWDLGSVEDKDYTKIIDKWESDMIKICKNYLI